MKRYLLITTLDVLRQTNNREHHLQHHLAPRFDATYVVFRRRCDGRALSARLVDALVPRARLTTRDGCHFLEVNPLLNHVQGLAMDLSGSYAMHEGRAPNSWRQFLYRLLSGLGVIKDASTIFFLFWFAWRRTPGRFDVCTAMGPWAAAAALWLRRVGKVRLCVYEDRDYEPGFIPTRLRRRMASALEIAGLSAADLRITISTRLARLRERETGRPVAVVTTGVTAGRFRAPRRDLHRPTLVYIGNVTFWSGLEMVLAAFPDIRRAHPGSTLIIAGDGLPGYRNRLEQQAHASGLGDAVRFLGRVDNSRMPHLLEQANVGVATFQPLALRRYAFPLKLLEYLAAGLPCIATEDTETSDVLLRHDCGVAVPFDAMAFAHAVGAVLAAPDCYQRMSANARAASLEYDWARLMNREYSLLKSAWESLSVSGRAGR